MQGRYRSRKSLHQQSKRILTKEMAFKKIVRLETDFSNLIALTGVLSMLGEFPNTEVTKEQFENTGWDNRTGLDNRLEERNIIFLCGGLILEHNELMAK